MEKKVPGNIIEGIQEKLRKEFEKLVDDLKECRDEWKKKYYAEFHKNGLLMKDVRALKRVIQIKEDEKLEKKN